MKKIISDSSSNLLSMDGVAYETVPLHILVGEKSFVDDDSLDIPAMYEALATHQGPTSTSCPSPNDWLTAFGDCEAVFCVTITSGLSGSYSSALAAKQIYEEEYPDREVYIFDSLSTGPEMVLIIEKLKKLITNGLDAKTIYEQTKAYQEKIHLYYALASLDNLAKNGRVNPLIAKGIGALGIRVIGTTTPEGTLKPNDKARGDKKAMKKIFSHMKSTGYKGGRVIISHSDNLASAEELKSLIEAEFGPLNGYIHDNTGLCSYYAEQNSVLVGFEEA